MFWGLVVQPNKKYSKTVSTPFHVSQAVLDVTNTPGESDVQLILKSDKVDYILCILNKAERVQMPLNLIFSEGDEISFRSVGGTVHLTGYLVDEQNLPEYEEDESSDEDVPTLVDASKQKGKRQMRQESSGSENEDSAESGEEVGSDDEEDVEDEMEADSDNESDEEIEEPPAKVPKTNGMPNGVSKKEDKNKDKKKDAKQKKQQQQQRQTVEVAEEDAADSKASSHQDLKIEEIREGKGAEVKMGRKVQVYYEGRFKSNNKIFDKATSGKGFEFTVGRGSVIRGWDVGVLGMRAGGKRRLICSPSMAYGKKGSPPAIPPNATLVFDIEIRNVH